MKLHHKALKIFISVSVAVLTSSLLVYGPVASDKAINAYMYYINEKADSLFLYGKYTNQNIAAHPMRTFSFPQEPASLERQKALHNAFDSVNGTHGFNLTKRDYLPLHDMSQTTLAGCSGQLDDISLLPSFDRAVDVNRRQKDYGQGLGTLGYKFRYYVDLKDNYVYFYGLIGSRKFAIHSWSFLQESTLGISQNDVGGIFTGCTMISSIYEDNLTEKKVMSFLTPAYYANKLKGVVMVDANKENLQNIFCTSDRPLVWRYLNVTVSDTSSGKEALIHEDGTDLFRYVRCEKDIPGGIRIALSLDVMYFIISSWKILAFYLLATILLLNMVRTHFRLYHNITREGVSDAMTGLYDRKILTPALEQRLQQLVNTGTLVAFIAIGCSRLKVINNTLGHKEGDRIIAILAKAIQTSVRKSDYVIRLGGDELCIILIDHSSELTPRLLEKARYNLQIITQDRSISFSVGVYNMQPDDTTDDAYRTSNAQLYLNRQEKHTDA